MVIFTPVMEAFPDPDDAPIPDAPDRMFFQLRTIFRHLQREDVSLPGIAMNHQLESFEQCLQARPQLLSSHLQRSIRPGGDIPGIGMDPTGTSFNLGFRNAVSPRDQHRQGYV